ncbi:hypothetical protein Tco_1151449 [Tanacetum coccineum]
MFKLDLDPLAPRLLQNREAHIDYLKHTLEQADILRGIVEQAKAKQPLDNVLYFSCKFSRYWISDEVHVQFGFKLDFVKKTKDMRRGFVMISENSLGISVSSHEDIAKRIHLDFEREEVEYCFRREER